MKFVIMVRDELGDNLRAHGTPFLEAEYEFPRFDQNDEAMADAFFAWRNNIEERAQKEWEATFGPECRTFLERLASDIQIWEWAEETYY